MSDRAPKPIIGYTSQNIPWDPLLWAIDICIRISGGKPKCLTPNDPSYEADIDGLIVGGGTDLFPSLYKQDPKPDYKYDHDRDVMELKWIRKMDKADKPVLGICRGAQMLNVSRGGNLHLSTIDLMTGKKHPHGFFSYAFYRKKIDIVSGSLLNSITGTQELEINSIHKQAIKNIGDGLTVTAQERDNDIVQAIEDNQRKFFLGIQFHPEILIYRQVFRDIFKAFVNTASTSFQD